MSENELIHHLLDRPALYLPQKTAGCLVAFLSGYLAGQRTAPTGLLDNLLEKTRSKLGNPENPTSHGLLKLVELHCQGDETKKFEFLVSALREELG